MKGQKTSQTKLSPETKKSRFISIMICDFFSLLSCFYFTPGKNMFNIAVLVVGFFSSGWQEFWLPVFLSLFFFFASTFGWFYGDS